MRRFARAARARPASGSHATLPRVQHALARRRPLRARARWQFCKLMVKQMSTSEDPDTLQEAFKILDKDGSGSITRDELKAVLNAFSKSGEDIDERDITDMINEADVDGDGSISFHEVRATRRTRTRPRASQAGLSEGACAPRRNPGDHTSTA